MRCTRRRAVLSLSLHSLGGGLIGVRVTPAVPLMCGRYSRNPTRNHMAGIHIHIHIRNYMHMHHHVCFTPAGFHLPPLPSCSPNRPIGDHSHNDAAMPANVVSITIGIRKHSCIEIDVARVSRLGCGR